MKDFFLQKYVRFWHWKFRMMNVNWRDSDMYTNGQYDEFPYENFDNFLNWFSIDKEFWKNHWKFVLVEIFRQAFILLVISHLLAYLMRK